MTIHNAFASWRRAHANGQSAARTLCKKSFLSYQVCITYINIVPIVSLCPIELAANRRDTPTIFELPSRRFIRPCRCRMPERALSVCPSLHLVSALTSPTSARFTSRQRVRFVSVPPDLNTNAQNSASWAINAALAAGLFPKLLIVEKGKMQTLGNSQPVAFHPSSVNFKKRPEDIVGGGTCLMYFTLMYVRCSLKNVS